MGISTRFDGAFRLDKPLSLAHQAYLRRFIRTRRMKRAVELLNGLPDPNREAVGLPLGAEGAYFVAEPSANRYREDPTILDYNQPPEGQPGLWCQWIPTEDGTAIVWDGREKFYFYTEWLDYLIAHFLKPWGYTLNGTVHWVCDELSDVTDDGEDVQLIVSADIVAKDNILTEANYHETTAPLADEDDF